MRVDLFGTVFLGQLSGFVVGIDPVSIGSLLLDFLLGGHLLDGFLLVFRHTDYSRNINNIDNSNLAAAITPGQRLA